MTRRLPATFGPDSRNRLEAATAPGIEGALAALETFYFAFNQRDPDVFARVWTQDALAQLNNPLGGILRGGEAISALHDKLFHGPARVTVIVDGREVPLRTRTSRYFRYEDGRWAQFHHHGSIDDAEELAAYQAASRADGSPGDGARRARNSRARTWGSRTGRWDSRARAWDSRQVGVRSPGLVNSRVAEMRAVPSGSPRSSRWLRIVASTERYLRPARRSASLRSLTISGNSDSAPASNRPVV